MWIKARLLLSAALLLSSVAVQGKIFVATPESVTMSISNGLTVQFSNQMPGITNNDSLVYLVVSATNTSRRPVQLSSSDFTLKDQEGKPIATLSGSEALKTAVDWNYEKSEGFVRVAGADLREVLRESLQAYTTQKVLAATSLKPKESLKERAIFFPRLPQGNYTLEIAGTTLQLKISDSVYFVASDKQ